jgi:hypothetical protein
LESGLSSSPASAAAATSDGPLFFFCFRRRRRRSFSRDFFPSAGAGVPFGRSELRSAAMVVGVRWMGWPFQAH